MSGSRPKVLASSETIGATSEPTVGSRTRFRRRRVNTMVVETDCAPEPAANSSKTLASGRWGGTGRTTRTGTGPSSTRAAGAQVLHGVGPLGRADIGRIALEGGVGDVVGQVQPVPQRAQLRLGHLLDLVGGVARLDLRSERPPLDRLGQDDRRRPSLLGGQLVGGIELAVVVAAAGQRTSSSSLRSSTILRSRGSGRRSAPGCRRRTRWPASGTRRPPWCSSGRAGRRRRPGRAARPSASPRSP